MLWGIRKTIVNSRMKASFSSSLMSISPLDGRYAKSTQVLQQYFSEYALIKYRTRVEVEWLKYLITNNIVKDARGLEIHFPAQDLALLDGFIDNFSLVGADRVKQIEAVTNHDVKAVEYYIKELLDRSHPQLKEYVHFLCTSEDINNLSYALMMTDAKNAIVCTQLSTIVERFAAFAEETADYAMLSRTHGQTASPTTVGKEVANFTYRINAQYRLLRDMKFAGKLNGAVGNFNAHMFAYPDQDWPHISRQFIKVSFFNKICNNPQSLDLDFNPYTTQIEPHDQVAQFYNHLSLLNTILIGFTRDMWTYISIGYFTQRTLKLEVGSSTMPHKVNPIDFENCEGSLGLCNALAQHFTAKLPISRLQRDLSDSTVMRNHGVALGYALVGWKSLQRGMDRIEPNRERLESDLDDVILIQHITKQHWEILAEPIQQVMRKYGMSNPYEQLKDITRGNKVHKEDLRTFISSLDMPHADKQKLMQLTPKHYIGNAAQMARDVRKYL